MQALVDNGPPPPCPTPFNLADYVLSAGQSRPDKIALAVVGASHAENLTYRDLRAAVLGTATGLKRILPEPGTPVLMRLANTADFPIAFLGAIAAGLIPVPTSSQLTGEEITAMANQIASGLILAAPDVALSNCDAPVVALDALRAMCELPAGDVDMGDPNRPAYMIFTSGTAGKPRAVVHAHRAVWARRMMWDGWYGLTDQDRLLHAGAFNWTYTLGTGLMDPWAAGATALIPGAGTAPDQLPALMADHGATIFAAAPGVYRQMLRAEMPLLPALRHGLSAGEKLPDTTRRAWAEATGLDIYEAFGMSECSTFISGAPGHQAPPGTLGFAQPGRKLAILGDTEPVARGEHGQIAVAASDPGLMLGYHGAPDETAARFSGDWFLTGDLGSMADDGSINYLGRNDDMMNAGGYRVSPIEVEAAMSHHPAIRECAAVEHEVKPGTTVIALYYSGTETDDHTLADFAAEHLARYKQPRLFFRIDALPRGANNKVMRRTLRASAGHDLARP